MAYPLKEKPLYYSISMTVSSTNALCTLKASVNYHISVFILHISLSFSRSYEPSAQI